MSIVALLIVASSVELDRVGEVLVRASVVPIALAIAVMVVAVLIRAAICHILLADAAERSFRTRRLIAPVFVGYLGNLVLPARIGELVRAYLIATRERVGLAAVLGAVALERIVDTAMLAVAAFVAALALSAASWVVQGTGVLAAIALLLLALLTTVGMQPAIRVAGRLASIPALASILVPVIRRLEEFAHTLGGAHRRRPIMLAAGVSIVAWTCNAIVFWLASSAVGAELTPPQVVLVMAVTVLSTAIPSAPGYIGTFELATVAVAMPLGVPRETAVAFAILAHLIGVVPTAIGGAIALARMGVSLGVVSAAAGQMSNAGASERPGAPA